MIKKSLKILPMIILSTCLYGFDFLDNVVEGYQNVKDTFKKGMEIGEASRWAYLSSRLFPEHMEEGMKKYGINTNDFCRRTISLDYVVATDDSPEHVKNAVKEEDELIREFKTYGYVQGSIKDYYEKTKNKKFTDKLYEKLEENKNKEDREKIIGLWMKGLGLEFPDDDDSGTSRYKAHRVYECHKNKTMDELVYSIERDLGLTYTLKTPKKAGDQAEDLLGQALMMVF